MRGRASSVIAVLSFAALAACGSPYGEKPSDGKSPYARQPSAPGEDTSGATEAKAPPTPAGGGKPAPQGTVVLTEDFEDQTQKSKFDVDKGSLTLVTVQGAKVGRVCADASGVGVITSLIGPPAAGTYVMSALVREDPSAPASTWALEATTFSPAPASQKAEGALAPVGARVSATTVIATGAFSTEFAIRIGTSPGTCMLVDDIQVTFHP